MKVLLSFLIIFLTSPVYGDEGWTKKITPEITLKAINLYKKDPTSEEAAGALSIVTNFAEKSSDVMVEIKQEYFPWEFGEINPDIESKLVGAYIAGNIEYQLIHKINKNVPLEGIKLVLYTYKKLREKDIFSLHKEFERWIAMEKKGELTKVLEI